MPQLLRELPRRNMGTVHTPRITSEGRAANNVSADDEMTREKQ